MTCPAIPIISPGSKDLHFLFFMCKEVGLVHATNATQIAEKD